MSRAMRRTVLATLLAGVLALAACGDGAEPDAQTTDAADLPGTEQQADLPEGVAATVGETDIGTQRLDERVDTALESPELAAQLPEDEEEARTLVQASVLGQMIVTEGVLQAADDEGIEVSDEEVQAKREELEEQAGGPEELQQQVDAIGFDEAELDRELRSLVILDRVAEREAPDEGEGPQPEQTDPAQPDPGDIAVQTWLQERLTQMEIVVDSDYGRWDAQSLQVVPPGMDQQQPAPPPQDQ